jgi:hypothetical protein
VCKGRWLEIRHWLKSCYAQWEDVGPIRQDMCSAMNVRRRMLTAEPGSMFHRPFGNISDFVFGLVDWRFVEQTGIPAGPWSLYDPPKMIKASSIF